ncbi:acyltransferase family protein [Lacrimispora sp. JR3]|uniref:acyltransferase family protein n=1 Tax=Lacrimispora sinapis TaxID=3111456 RepID=UPI003747C282
MEKDNVIFSNGYREALSTKTTIPDILKVFAVLSVMMQGILGAMMKQDLTISQQAQSVVILDLVKYSAPFFIFAICFDISKIKNVPYKTHVFHKAKELLVPYFLWTTVYILIDLSNYHSVKDILKGYLLGSSAPHTWYLVMMFQFHLLVPVLWYLHAKLSKDRKKIGPVLLAAFIFYTAFVYYYDTYIFGGRTNPILLYFDRSFIGFSIYAILGTVASSNVEKWESFVSKAKLAVLPLICMFFLIENREMFSYGMEHIKLSNSLYLRISTFCYDVFAIIAVYGFGLVLIKNHSKLLVPFRFLAQYAYRAYLANYFLIFVLIKIMGEPANSLPYGFHLFFLWLMTAIMSFSLVYGIEFALKYVPQLLKGKNVREEQQYIH